MRAAVIASCLFVLLTAETASAQVRRYTPPAGRTLPGALNYFRRDTGVLDPYNAFVAPQRNLQQDLRNLADRQEQDEEQQSRLRQQDQEQSRQYRLKVEEQAKQLRLQVRPAAGGAAGSGEGIGGGNHPRFNNFSHFYQTPTPQRTNRRQ